MQVAAASVQQLQLASRLASCVQLHSKQRLIGAIKHPQSHLGCDGHQCAPTANTTTGSGHGTNRQEGGAGMADNGAGHSAGRSPQGHGMNSAAPGPGPSRPTATASQPQGSSTARSAAAAAHTSAAGLLAQVQATARALLHRQAQTAARMMQGGQERGRSDSSTVLGCGMHSWSFVGQGRIDQPTNSVRHVLQEESDGLLSQHLQIYGMLGCGSSSTVYLGEA
jgi:hypothetical protein